LHERGWYARGQAVREVRLQRAVAKQSVADEPLSPNAVRGQVPRSSSDGPVTMERWQRKS
jgi:hypothetical protein